VPIRGLAGEKVGAVHSVVAKLTALALASAAALTGTKEKRSYALVNDTWSLLIAMLIGIGQSTCCPTGSGKRICLDGLLSERSGFLALPPSQHRCRSI